MGVRKDGDADNHVALFGQAPLQRGASQEEAAAHDQRADELARYKLGRISGDYHDGYHRVACPALMGKVRCPLREPSMMLDLTRPEVTTPPEDPAPCCTQRTITVPASVNQKTAQRHDYPSRTWRLSDLTPLLCPAQCRRTGQRPDQGPRHDRRQPGVVPTDGARADGPVVGHRHRRAQPGRGRRLLCTPRRRPAPRTRRRRRTTLGELAGASRGAPP